MVKKCCSHETIEGHQVKWEKPIGHGWYAANPHCLDENNIYKLRQCFQNSLSQDHFTCRKIQKTISFCPDGLSPNKLQNQCFVVLEKATYHDSKCPYHFEYKFTHQNELRNEPVWLPVERASEFGEFLYTEIFETYKTPVKYVKYKSKKNDSNCLVSLHNTFEAVSCNSRYRRVCTYNMLHNGENRYCHRYGQILKYTCINVDFDTEKMTCICAKPISNDCTMFELKHPFQNSIGKLVNNCLIPLEKKQTLQWAISKQPVNYTYWSNSTVGSNNKLQNIVLTEDGWATEQEPQCKICEHIIEPYQPEIEISFQKNQNKIFINITHVLSLAVSADRYNVFCITNALKDSVNRSIFLMKLDQGSSASFTVNESGLYWCEAFSISNFSKIVSNAELVILENIYAIQIELKYEEYEDPTSSATAYTAYIKRLEDHYNLWNDKHIKMKWMKTISVLEDEQYVKYLLHICTPLKEDNYLEDFNSLKKNLNQSFGTFGIPIKSSNLLSTKYCMETTEVINGVVLKWKRTEIGEHASSVEACLDFHGKQIFRNCIGDYFTGAYWSNLQEEFTCSHFENKSEYTDDLSNLLNSTASTNEVTHNLTIITQNSPQFQAVDIFLISSILKKIQSDIVNLQNLTDIISNTMQCKRQVLKDSQFEQNATDLMLHATDVILANNKRNYSNALFESKSLINFVFNTNVTNYKGLALLATSEGYRIKKIPHNFTLKNVLNLPNLEIATFLPHKLLEEISKNDDASVVISIFLQHCLFNEESSMHQVISKNFGILLPENIQTTYTIPIIFKPNDNTIQTSSCGFWNFLNKNLELIKGVWTLSKESQHLGNHLYLCEFNHVTHFGLLLSNKAKPSRKALDVITTVECVLSIFGIFGLFLTAALFKNWRNNKGNRLLMDYSALSFIQICLLYISDNFRGKFSNDICIFIGAALHYVVLSQFCLSLVIAVFQYRRYVQVFNQSIKWVLFKSYLTCFLLPIFPVGILFVFFRDSYIGNEKGLCYPTGGGLIYSVLIPIACIVSVNLLIFFKINLELFRSKSCSMPYIQNNEYLLRLRLVILMFFLLGLSWVFGFTAQILESDFFLYLFNITASLQGFVIFLFFIVFNKNVRCMYTYMWKKYTCPS